MKRRNFCVLVLLGFLIIFPLVSEGAAPTRTDVYVSQTTIDPAAVTRNENAIFTYLQAGVDTVADNTITSANIIDGVIVNADVSSSAAIVGSKLDLSSPGAIGGTTPAAGAFTTISFTGGQLAFPATQSSSTGVNTLDDYEEGYHTAVITCSTSGSYTLDSSHDTLAYTKIGRLVAIQGYLSVTGESSPNGELRISVPFTPTDLTESSDVWTGSANLVNHGGTLTNGAFLRGGASNAFFNLYSIADDGTVQALDQDDVDTAWQLYVSFSYISE